MNALAVLAAAASLAGATDQGGTVDVAVRGDRADTRIRWSARCRGADIIAQTTRLSARVGRDGAFARRSFERQRFDDGGSAAIRARVTGRLTGASASGSWSVRVAFFDAAGAERTTCRSGVVRWHAARRLGGPPAGARYRGLSRQATRVEARVSPGGRRITVSLPWRALCPSGVLQGTTSSLRVAVAPGGTFAGTSAAVFGDQRHGTNAVVWVRVRDGRATADGVRGTWRTTVFIRDAQHRLVEVCDSRDVPFAARRVDGWRNDDHDADARSS